MIYITVIVPGWEKEQLFSATSLSEAVNKAKKNIPLTMWENSRIFVVDQKEFEDLLELYYKK